MVKKTFSILATLLFVAQGVWGQLPQVTVYTEAELFEAVEESREITLGADIQLSSCLKFISNSYILNLNGHTLSRNMAAPDEWGQVICIMDHGRLWINDNGNNSGKITGGWSYQGGAIYVYKECDLFFNGGTITGNRADVISAGNLGFGGAIECHGTMEMNGGVITGNTAGQYGGGIYVGGRGSENEGKLILTGGTIIGNTAGKAGGGIYQAKTTIELSGNPVVKNNTADDLYMSDYQLLTVTGAFTTGASIGLANAYKSFTVGYATNNSGTDPTTIFFANDDGHFRIAKFNDGEVCMGVKYIECSWDKENKKVVQTIKWCTDYILLDQVVDNSGNSYFKTFPDDYDEPEAWIVVRKNMTFEKELMLDVAQKHLTVNLILCDYTTLTAKRGIYCGGWVNPSTLNIYAQTIEPDKYKGGEIAGKIIAGSSTINEKYGPGIGGNSSSIGNFNIHGGVITAQGSQYAAGIGGDQGTELSLESGVITIYNGYVEATGGEGAAGIGGGCASSWRNSDGGLVYIYGGTVKAQGGKYGAGVGGGGGYSLILPNTWNDGSDGGTVIVHGGKLEAIGGDWAAGIGGGYAGKAGMLFVLGGDVKAWAGYECESTEYKGGCAVGCGNDINKLEENVNGTIDFADNIRVRAGTSDYESTTTVFTNLERVPACIWRHFAHISVCDHTTPGGQEEAKYYTIDTEAGTHTMHCRYCNYTETEHHKFTSGTGSYCYVCGKKKDLSDDYWYITVHRARTETEWDQQTYLVLKGSSFTLPDITVPKGLKLEAFQKDTAPASIEMSDAELEEARKDDQTMFFDVSQSFSPTANTHFYARYRYAFTEEWTWYWTGTEPTATLTLKNQTGENSTDPITAVITKEVPEDGSELEREVATLYTATATFEHAEGCTYEFTDHHHFPFLQLTNNEDNSEAIRACDKQLYNVQLYGRTFYKDGKWNTLCLPFNVSEEQIEEESHPLYGAEIRTLERATFDSGILTLNFSDPVSAIVAGRPYIVRWPISSSESAGMPDLTDPIFKKVTVSSGTPATYGYDAVDFVGIYNPYVIDGEDRTILYLGANNTLYYPNDAMTIGACRAYFKLKGITVGDLQQAPVLNFGDEGTTTLNSLSLGEGRGDAWFTLDGRRLSGKPSQSGVYLNNGKKIVIK